MDLFGLLLYELIVNPITKAAEFLFGKPPISKENMEDAKETAIFRVIAGFVILFLITLSAYSSGELFFLFLVTPGWYFYFVNNLAALREI